MAEIRSRVIRLGFIKVFVLKSSADVLAKTKECRPTPFTGVVGFYGSNYRCLLIASPSRPGNTKIIYSLSLHFQSKTVSLHVVDALASPAIRL